MSSSLNKDIIIIIIMQMSRKPFQKDIRQDPFNMRFFLYNNCHFKYLVAGP